MTETIELPAPEGSEAQLNQPLESPALEACTLWYLCQGLSLLSRRAESRTYPRPPRRAVAKRPIVSEHGSE